MERPIDLEDIARGDRQVMNRMYHEYQPDFRNWVRKMFKIDSGNAKEIFQDSMVTLYENVINGRLVEMKSSIKTYLFSIGRNKALEFLRKTGRTDSISGLDDVLIDEDELDFESDFETLKKSRLMKACIRELGDTCQEIMKLYYFEMLNLAEIKDKLKYKNEESVKSQKFKCMERLRASFLKQYQGWR